MTGYDSSLMGSLNVMHTYQTYFTLTTATTALNTCSSYVGGCLGSLFAGFVADKWGRRCAIWIAAAVTIIGAALQAGAVHIAMFIVARIIIGVGMAVAATATPTFIVETCKESYRSFSLGVYYACWGVGTLLATGVCYASNGWATTWAWRFPSLFQIVPAIFAAMIVCCIPESPRWLISQDRDDEALEVLAIINSQGDKCDPIVLRKFREISSSIRYGREEGRQLTLFQAWTSKANRKRLTIVGTFSIIVMLSGQSIIDFYFGSMLSQAGITSSKVQLEVNIILNSWNLVLGCAAAWFVDVLPRKLLCSLSLGFFAIFMYLLGGLTARYGDDSGNRAGIYGTIASLFLCSGAYRLGITPLTMLYPAEILSYQLRATGMGLYTFTTKASGLVSTVVSPFALDAIGWKTYIIFSSADMVMVILVLIFWVESRGLSLEEIDKKFQPSLCDLEGRSVEERPEKHSEKEKDAARIAVS
ncbi:general substrate transporter [Aspergillus pseudoustus]|uniref:General substrate transporter n=1 Tax=Aspergillus pseudoustus TaxID=1810923 RepID=A0ABR4KFE4_9EURO